MDAKAIHERLAAKFGEKITATGLDAVSPFVVVATDAIAEVAAFCKAAPDLAFDNLMCLAAVDYPKETPPRMEVVSQLNSYKHLHTFALKVHVPREALRGAFSPGSAITFSISPSPAARTRTGSRSPCR